MIFGYVYISQNKINGKRYIGRRKGAFQKWYVGSGKAIKQAIKKYGYDSFSVKVIEYCYSNKDLNEREMFWIRYFNAVSDPSFYNIAHGGQGGSCTSFWKGKKLSEEHKRHISEGLLRNGHIGERNIGRPAWNKGVKASNETKEKMSKITSERWENKEYRQRMIDVHIGQKAWNKGLHISTRKHYEPHTEETKKKISDSKKGNTCHQNVISFNGEKHNIKKWAEICNVHSHTISNRLKRCLPIEYVLKEYYRKVA